jgi:hypothetical protein
VSSRPRHDAATAFLTLRDLSCPDLAQPALTTSVQTSSAVGRSLLRLRACYMGRSIAPLVHMAPVADETSVFPRSMALAYFRHFRVSSFPRRHSTNILPTVTRLAPEGIASAYSRPRNAGIFLGCRRLAGGPGPGLGVAVAVRAAFRLPARGLVLLRLPVSPGCHACRLTFGRALVSLGLPAPSTARPWWPPGVSAPGQRPPRARDSFTPCLDTAITPPY